MVAAAHIWLSRNYRVLPVQPNTKKLVRGYGPHLADLKEPSDLEEWFRFRSCNLAVIPPEGHVILDFDLIEIYNQFAQNSPEASRSYAEDTPRKGRHIFLADVSGNIPDFADVVPGLEIKRIALVFPSKVADRQYTPVNTSPILAVNLAASLQGFATVKTTSEAPSPVPGSPVGNLGHSTGNSAFRDVLRRVRENWPLLTYFQLFEPRLKLSGNGRFRSGLCPWHKDTHPSLWVDTERNFFGCFSCSATGDVVSWHAMRHNLSQGRAARDLDAHRSPVEL